MLSCCSRVWLCATRWTVAPQAPQSMEFSRQVYWSGLPHPPPGDLSNPWIEPVSSASPALQVDSLNSEPRGKPPSCNRSQIILPWYTSQRKYFPIRAGKDPNLNFLLKISVSLPLSLSTSQVWNDVSRDDWGLQLFRGFVLHSANYRICITNRRGTKRESLTERAPKAALQLNC